MPRVLKVYEKQEIIEIVRQKKRVQKVHAIQPQQPPALPGRNQMKVAHRHPHMIPAAGPSPLPVVRGDKVRFGNHHHNVKTRAPKPVEYTPTLVVKNRPKPRPVAQPWPPVPPAPVVRAEEAKQWHKKRNKQGKEYYINRVTKDWQFETPECLKKYPRYL